MPEAKKSSPIKRTIWWKKRITDLEKQVEILSNLNHGTNGNGELDIDSYARGFYDCMCKYGIFHKAARKRVLHTIKERYKGDGETKFVWRVK